MQDILEELKKGNFVVVLDDKNREDEADLVLAAEFVTAEKIAFILKHCCGIICVPMTLDRVMSIGIPVIGKINEEDKTAPFTVAVDAKECHTGVSAIDRCLTIKKLCEEDVSVNDFVIPGHVFPLYAHKDGLKARKGHTEAAVELVKKANLKEVAVICELMKENGEMMKGKDVEEFCGKNGLKCICIKDIE